MTGPAAVPDDHPWYLDLRPDPAKHGRDTDALAALQALDALGATVIAVHADTLPSLADLVAGRCYVGWTILVPGSVEQAAIEAIGTTAIAGYRMAIVPGHPLPPTNPRIEPITSHHHTVPRPLPLPAHWTHATPAPAQDAERA